MRIERLRLDAFGRLADLETGPEALPGLVVVLGPNEAGKSTVFHFLTSMLYGFYPASRENNPYAPWDGADPGGSLTLRLGSGGCVEVERRLMSSPSGKMTVDGRQDDLRNRTVPWAEHVPRTVFRQVYALTLAELAGLDEETWGRVQDRIVGAMGATDLRPARHVVADLEQEAGELWRPNRRGNQRIRDIQAIIRDLRDRRRGAVERDRKLREVVALAETARAELQEVREARQRARLAVERVQALVPIRTQLRRIEALREDAGPSDTLQDLPADPVREVERLRSQVSTLERRREEVRQERAAPQAAVEALGDRERKLLGHQEDIARFLGRATALAGERARLAALEQETRDLERRLEMTAAPLFTASDPETWPAAAAVPVTELRERLRRLQAAREDRRALEAAYALEPSEAPPTPTPTRSPWAPVATLVVGAALLGVGLWRGSQAATAAGAAAFAVGVALLLGRARGTGQAAPTQDVEIRLRGARGREEEARRAVLDLLSGLPLAQAMVDNPGETLGSGLERLQELLRDRGDRMGAAEGLRAEIRRADEAAGELAEGLGLDGSPDAEALAHILERETRRAERVAEAATGAERELARIDREGARIDAELSEASEALRSLTLRLEAEGNGDATKGAHHLRERIQAAERAAQLQEDMERQHPDLDEIRARIRDAESAGDSWTVDDDDLARRKALVEELSERAEALAARAEALDRDAAHLGDAETVDAVDGEITARQEEEQALLLERDRLWVLARLVRQADRRFREEHQPDLVRRAGGYLGKLTGGRYDRIAADESSGVGRFQIYGPATPTPLVLAPPLSTGTLEQAYLALRLAIVDHLDRGLERLPLFVDEVFVNWDDERRRQGLDLLADVATQRQVFAFTCHPDVASELERRGGMVLRVGPAKS